MIIIISERQHKLIKEQLWLNAARFGAHEANTGSGWDQGLQKTTTYTKNYSDQQKVANLFKVARSWSSTSQDWNTIKNTATQIKTALEGMGSGNFLTLLSQINTKAKLAALIKNWSYGGKNLFQWLAEEYTISWGDILNVLKKYFSSYIVNTYVVNNQNLSA